MIEIVNTGLDKKKTAKLIVKNQEISKLTLINNIFVV